MNRRMRMAALPGLVVLTVYGLGAKNEPTQSWITTWSVPQMLAQVTQHYSATLPSIPPTANRRELLPAALPPTAPLLRKTVRMIVHTSLGGSRLRVRLSSAYGSAGLWLWGAHVALSDGGAKVVTGTDRELKFNGSAVLKIPPGAEVVSDRVDLRVGDGGDLTISLYLPLYTGAVTEHQFALHRAYTVDNNAAGELDLPQAAISESYLWISGVDVLRQQGAGAIAVLGDSLAAGIGSAVDKNQDWPAQLFKRMQQQSRPMTAVLNAGLFGNRLLRDGPGVNALARFDRDVAAKAGVRWVIAQLGTYDIGAAVLDHQDMDSADELIGGFKQLIENAHGHGMFIAGCTIPPFAGSYCYKRGYEKVRAEANEWIRIAGAWDAVLDFDAVLRDPADGTRLVAEFDSGDHITLNERGYEALAKSVSLDLFTNPKAKNR